MHACVCMSVCMSNVHTEVYVWNSCINIIFLVDICISGYRYSDLCTCYVYISYYTRDAAARHWRALFVGSDCVWCLSCWPRLCSKCSSSSSLTTPTVISIAALWSRFSIPKRHKNWYEQFATHFIACIH